MDSSDKPLDRRRFIKLTGGVGASVVLGRHLAAPVRAADDDRHGMPRAYLDLDGAWQVREVGKKQAIAATVPGCIHTDLLAAGEIPDPFVRDNAHEVQWVDARDWSYTRAFEVDAALMRHPSVELVCAGLDTLATIHINGKKVADVDNMFRRWRFDIRQALVEGRNTIEIVFRSLLPYMDERQKSAPHRLSRGDAWVRKAAYMFSWDWAPALRSCGIWRTIGIEGRDSARISDLAITQAHAADKVDLELRLDVHRYSQAALQARITVSGHGPRRTVTLPIAAGAETAQARISIRDPQLWWPSGMGGQPLYRVAVDLLDADGRRIDTRTRRIGLRTVTLIPDSDAHPLQLQVNGVAFFAKGANWVPPDSFPSRVTTSKLRGLVQLAVDTHMNILRFWGGGYYEEDVLYDLCDEKGLLVWLDFKFANSSFPVFDAHWMDNVRHEIRDNVQRLRHHPCIAVWSGNNEVGTMLGKDWQSGHFPQEAYDALFQKLIPDTLHTQYPGAAYTPGSPYSGDTHDWDVWHGEAPFESYLKVHGFMTEFGFQSFPVSATVDAFTDAADRRSVNSGVMKFHQRDGSGRGNQMIVDAIHRYLGVPRSFDDTLYLSQIAQAFAVQIGAEHWRRDYPRSTACIYWQYNDCWPSVSWASIDYHNRPKALQFAARRFYRPLLVSARLDEAQAAMDIVLSNDQAHRQSGRLSCRITDAGGRILRKQVLRATVPARTSQSVHRLDLADLLRAHGSGDLIVWMRYERAGTVLSENVAFFGRPRALALKRAHITPTVKSRKGGFDITLRTDRVALWTMLELEGASFHDNFLHLRPGQAATVRVDAPAPMTLAQARQQVRVRSLLDMVQARPV